MNTYIKYFVLSLFLVSNSALMYAQVFAPQPDSVLASTSLSALSTSSNSIKARQLFTPIDLSNLLWVGPQEIVAIDFLTSASSGSATYYNFKLQAKLASQFFESNELLIQNTNESDFSTVLALDSIVISGTSNLQLVLDSVIRWDGQSGLLIQTCFDSVKSTGLVNFEVSRLENRGIISSGNSPQCDSVNYDTLSFINHVQFTANSQNAFLSLPINFDFDSPVALSALNIYSSNELYRYGSVQFGNSLPYTETDYLHCSVTSRFDKFLQFPQIITDSISGIPQFSFDYHLLVNQSFANSYKLYIEVNDNIFPDSWDIIDSISGLQQVSLQDAFRKKVVNLPLAPAIAIRIRHAANTAVDGYLFAIDNVEFSYGDSLDLGLETLIEPQPLVTAPFDPLIFTIRNFGSTAIDTASVELKINGIAVDTIGYGSSNNSSPLLTDKLDTIDAGFITVKAGDNLELRILTVNSATDANALNDTIIKDYCLPLSGTINVGPGEQFTSLGNALLAVQNCGIDNNLVLNLTGTGPFIENIRLLDFPKASSSLTLTINGNDLEIYGINSIDRPSNAIHRIRGVENLVFNNIKFSFYAPAGFRSFNGFQIYDQSSHITFNGCSFIQVDSSFADVSTYLNTGENTGLNQAPNNYITINDCEFIGSDIAMIFDASQDFPFHGGHQIVNSRFIDQLSQGVIIFQSDSVLVSQNQFSISDEFNGTRRSGFYALSLIDVGNANVTGNTFNDAYIANDPFITMANVGHLKLSGNYFGTANSSITIANNLFELKNPFQGEHHFINNELLDLSIDRLFILHNTFVAQGASSPNLALTGIYTTPNTTFQNNVVYLDRKENGTTRFFEDNFNVIDSTFLSNYNAFWTSDTAINGIHDGGFITWQSSTGRDLNSLFENPLFIDFNGLSFVPNNPALDQNGVFAGVIDDFDGNLRDTIGGVDIGYLDFTAGQNLQMIELISPRLDRRQNTSSDIIAPEPITVKLVNSGTAINSINLTASFNQQNITEVANLPLNTGDTLIYTFATDSIFVNQTGNYNINIWIDSTSDLNALDDTLHATLRYLPNASVQLNNGYSPDVANLERFTALGDAFGIANQSNLDFEGNSALARVTVNSENLVAPFFNSVITLDKIVNDQENVSSSLIVTTNLEQYQLIDSISFSFSYAHHNNKQDLDSVYVRGSDTSSWIGIYDLFVNQSQVAGAYVEASPINLSAILGQNGQTFTSSTQLKFTHTGSAPAQTSEQFDGISISNIQLSFDTINQDLSLDMIRFAYASIPASQQVLPFAYSLRNTGRAQALNAKLFIQTPVSLDSILIGNLDSFQLIETTDLLNLPSTLFGLVDLKVWVKSDATEQRTSNDTLNASVFIDRARMAYELSTPSSASLVSTNDLSDWIGNRFLVSNSDTLTALEILTTGLDSSNQLTAVLFSYDGASNSYTFIDSSVAFSVGSSTFLEVPFNCFNILDSGVYLMSVRVQGASASSFSFTPNTSFGQESFYFSGGNWLNASVALQDGNFNIRAIFSDNYNVPTLFSADTISICASDTFTLFTENGFESYNWSTSEIADTISVSLPGDYFVTATNQFGCVFTDSVVLLNDSLPVFSLIADTSFCAEDSIVLRPSAIDNSYSYSWNEGLFLSEQIAINQADTYRLTLIDGNGCSFSDTVIITLYPDVEANWQNDYLKFALNSTQDSLQFSFNGQATSAKLGILPNNFYNAFAAGLGLDTINFEFSDTNTCQRQSIFEIEVVDSLLVLGQVQNLSCAGLSDGQVALTIQGGVLPYQILWSTGDSLLTLNNLDGGNYSVTVTDSINQLITLSFALSEPDTLQLLQLSQSNVNCYGDSTASIEFEVTGGNGGNSFIHPFGQNIGDTALIDLPASSFQYIVQDSLGCADSILVNVSQPDSIAVQILVTNATCASNQDGTATAIASGGAGTLTYNFSTGSILPYDSALFQGLYSVQVTDTLGCFKLSSFEIVADPPPAVTFVVIDTLICENTDTIQFSNVSPTGGIFSGLGILDDSLGTYLAAQVQQASDTVTYTFTNEFGCADSARVIFEFLQAPQLQINDTIKVCADGVSILLDGGSASPLVSPSGGFYKGEGITQNVIFNPQLVNPDTIALTYVYTNAFGCVDSILVPAIVDSLPSVSIDTFPTICLGDEAFQLTQGKPMGGIYTLQQTIPGLIIGSDTLNPAAPGIPSNGINITYSFSDANGCSASSSSLLLINPLPQVVLNTAGVVCFDSSGTTFQVTTGAPLGGIYQGTGIDSAGNFDVGQSPGTYSLSYTYVDADGCVASDTNTIVIRALPQVTLNAFNDTCISNPPFLLSGGQPSGGQFTGVNVVANSYYPANAGVGLDTVYYSFTDAFGCQSTTFDVVRVDSLPLVSLIIGDSICSNATVDTVNFGIPAGGVYSGTGINPTTAAFNPAGLVGIQPITYTYTDPITGCTNSATSSRTVLPSPIAIFNPIQDFCETDNTFQITTAGPSGGVFGGIGITPQGQFDPTAGIGQRQLSYAITNLFGCSDTAFQTITVNPNPVATLAGFNPVCEGGNAFLLSGGSPAGGQFFGQNVSGSFFNPSGLTPGFDTVYYAYQDQNGCRDTVAGSIEILGLPVVSFTDSFPKVCANGSPVQFTQGLPSGGVYSGNAISGGGIFNPTLTSPGTIPINYTYTDTNGCVNSATQSATVLAIPVIIFPTISPLCANDDSVLVTNATPAGGVYTGPASFNPSSGFFNPIAAGVGAFPISYTRSVTTDTVTCTNTVTRTVFVNQLPLLDLRLTEDNTCPGFATSVVASGGVKYLWNTSDTTAQINVNPRNTTTYSVIATNTANCSIQDSIVLNVISGLSIEAVLDSVFTEFNTAFEFDVAANDSGNISTASILRQPVNGTLTQLFGTVFEYVPNQDFRRIDTIIYKVCDEKCFDVCDTGTWKMRVLGDPYQNRVSGFSPNGDGINDLFVIPGIELYPSNTFIVFNRSGEPVFEASPYTNDWDGRINAGFLTTGNKVQDGTYFYVLDMGNGNAPLEGFIEVKSK